MSGPWSLWARGPKDDDNTREVSQPVEPRETLTIPTEIQRGHPIAAYRYGAYGGLGVMVCLPLVLLYNRFLRRIPRQEYLRPNDFRKRTFYGYVPSVGDGDNFHFFHTPGGRLTGWGWLQGRRVQDFPKPLVREKGTIHLRLAAIDAPEMSHFGKPEQPFAPEALAALRKEVLGKYVRVRFFRRDQYDRVVGVAWYYKWWFWKTDVCMAMLKKGMAGMYEGTYNVEFGDREEEYRAAEKRAKKQKVGMWKQGKALVTPGEWKTRTAVGGSFKRIPK
ncbi:putative endonuclease lcl3 [Elasticomyces elasticus]|nr:putative endonuclease lcl3 [Elasticomyces elasticus]KAK3657095.1 putative endonuclease lcl3 [Elasticomyces elasticus]KAK4926676.1 putative endonuclease lcl3 [Elasticomyces elasticus]KAK5762373.1 putative endonuclease lcl3 [Elasticomyces elasticus]